MKKTIKNYDGQEELIKKVVSKINNFNRKIKKFKDEGITQHSNLVESAMRGIGVPLTNKGAITKSKNFFKTFSHHEILKLNIAIDKLDTHDTYGTITKFKKFRKRTETSLINTVEERLKYGHWWKDN